MTVYNNIISCQNGWFQFYALSLFIVNVLNHQNIPKEIYFKNTKKTTACRQSPTFAHLAAPLYCLHPATPIGSANGCHGNVRRNVP